MSPYRWKILCIYYSISRDLQEIYSKLNGSIKKIHFYLIQFNKNPWTRVIKTKLGGLPSGDNCGSFSLGTKCITVLFPGGNFKAVKCFDFDYLTLSNFTAKLFLPYSVVYKTL